MDLLRNVVLRDGDKLERKRVIFWTKYIGTIMYVICGVHPGGNIRDGAFTFSILQKEEGDNEGKELTNDEAMTPTTGETSSRKKREFEVVVRISKDDLKTSASVRSRIITLQKKIRKLSKGSSEKVKVSVQFFEAQ